MSISAKPVVSRHHSPTSVRRYVIGFLLALYITLVAYILTVRRALSLDWLVAMIVGLALLQFVVQLIFFLHVGAETRPRWKLAVFWVMILVICILVFGSLWIMANLNYRMTPEQVTNYLHGQDGL